MPIAKTLSTAPIRPPPEAAKNSTKGALVHIPFPMMRRCGVHEAARRADVAFGGAGNGKTFLRTKIF